MARPTVPATSPALDLTMTIPYAIRQQWYQQGETPYSCRTGTGFRIHLSGNPTNQELGLEILPLVKFRPANPRVLPSDRDTLIVAAEAHIDSVAVTDLEGLVLFQRKGECPSDTRTRLSSDAVDDAA